MPEPTEYPVPAWVKLDAEVMIVDGSWHHYARPTTVTKITKRYVETTGGVRWSLVTSHDVDNLHPTGDRYLGGTLYDPESQRVAEIQVEEKQRASFQQAHTAALAFDKALTTKDPAQVAVAAAEVAEAAALIAKLHPNEEDPDA